MRAKSDRAISRKTTLSMAIASSIVLVSGVHAQSQSMRLEEIIVTAQKRVQSVQDIPVAVTALPKEQIEVNKVLDVNDLSGLAPNLTVRPSAGGVNVPAFNMRGISSYGVVAGSDKQISTYLDGVYIGSPRGGIFTLPDIQQLEVLRGPQGTLFGRNATGGAISIRTRDPAGELQFRQEISVGNRDHFGTETTIDFPSVGPFSAYLTYAKEERDGDVDNLGGGTTWDRTAFGYGTASSPDKLGNVDSETIFLSTYFDFGDLTISYKFDYNTDEGTPRANAILTDIDTTAIPSLTPLLGAIAAANSELLSPTTSRPDAVNNAFTTTRDQKVQGHNLYLEWAATDELTVKNTLAYREVEVFQPADISGTSGWIVGPIGAFLGPPFTNDFNGPYDPDTPFCYACSQANAEGDQWSNELQFDYDGELLTVISGLLYYESEDESGSPVNSVNTFTLSNDPFFPGYVVPRAAQSVSYNEAKSYAAYSQAEIHITDSLDILAGVRYTKDEKSGSFVTGLPEDPIPGPGDENPTTAENPDGGYWSRTFDYENDNVDYLIGLNYQVSDFIMTYIKFSTAYVSGGSVASFEFDPEEVESWEIGAKADFFDSRLRTNIAIFDAEYDNLQTAQSGQNIEGADGIGVLVVQGGRLEAEGVELEVSVLPVSGLTIAATLGYVNAEIYDPPEIVLQSVFAAPVPDGSQRVYENSGYEQTLTPEWNGNLSINYESEPLFGSSYVTFGVTGIWRDKIRFDANPGRAENSPTQGPAEFTPETWIINARLALRDIRFSSDWSGEVALWGRNLTDDDSPTFSTNFGAFPSGTFEEERSYGIDFVVRYR